jgi:hypothetical protein
MARRVETEFWCQSECKKYFKFWLRENMFGNYTIECPNCRHHHFRWIENGVVSEKRHSQPEGQTDVIQSMKSTIRDVPWHDDPTFRRNELRAYQGGA